MDVFSQSVNDLNLGLINTTCMPELQKGREANWDYRVHMEVGKQNAQRFAQSDSYYLHPHSASHNFAGSPF